MTSKVALFIPIAAATALAAQPALSNDNPFSLELSVGGEYDSNIAVPQADLLAAEGDFAGIFGARFGFEPISGKKGGVRFGYSFDQSLYTDLDQFNMQTHAISGGGNRKFGKANVGANYTFYHIRLGGDALLDMHVIAPSVSGFVTKKFYARAYYNYFDKNFSTLTNRDASAHNAGISVNRFFANPKGYISVGARFDTENAVDPELDFDGYQLTGNLQLPVSALNDDARVNFGVSYRERDYDAVTASIGAIRTEERYRFRSLFETPLTDHLEVQFQYRYTDRDSNFLAANYIEHRATTELTYKF